MFMSKGAVLIAGALILVACTTTRPERLGLGREVTEADIVRWNIDASPDNGGLPPGRGGVAEGRKIYDRVCAVCHGGQGEGVPPSPRLAGGAGSLATAKPVQTIGSFWPYSVTVFDYVRRAMPFPDPGSLSDDQVYAVTAYLLHLNGIVPADTDLDGPSLAAIRMPNRSGFIRDDRPDTGEFARSRE